MTHYIKQSNIFRVAPEGTLDIYDTLPPNVYMVEQDRDGTYFLDTIDNFTLPKKIYGDVSNQVERIINTFNDRTVSTGIMLSGEKGSGKTMLTKRLALDTQALGLPTLIVNQPHYGDDFNKFIQHINQPCMILFDEFEKIYKPEVQAHILTLLDGVFVTKKLFVFTCNESSGVIRFLDNRPGRIYYHLRYRGLSNTFIKDYCDDVLHNKHHIDKICQIAVLFDEFNFDMLQALVEEMNRYDETPQQALSMLNVSPSINYYDIAVTHDGVDVSVDDLYPEYIECNPLHPAGFKLEFKYGEDSFSITVTPDILTNIDTVKNTFTFTGQDCSYGRDIVTLTKRKAERFTFSNFNSI
jgi:hypothetical protein